MVKYEKHTDEENMKKIKDCIFEYMNNSNSQRECYEKYGITKSTFSYYYNILKNKEYEKKLDKILGPKKQFEEKKYIIPDMVYEENKHIKSNTVYEEKPVYKTLDKIKIKGRKDGKGVVHVDYRDYL